MAVSAQSGECVVRVEVDGRGKVTRAYCVGMSEQTDVCHDALRKIIGLVGSRGPFECDVRARLIPVNPGGKGSGAGVSWKLGKSGVLGLVRDESNPDHDTSQLSRRWVEVEVRLKQGGVVASALCTDGARVSVSQSAWRCLRELAGDLPAQVRISAQLELRDEELCLLSQGVGRLLSSRRFVEEGMWVEVAITVTSPSSRGRGAYTLRGTVVTTGEAVHITHSPSLKAIRLLDGRTMGRVLVRVWRNKSEHASRTPWIVSSEKHVRPCS